MSVAQAITQTKVSRRLKEYQESVLKTEALNLLASIRKLREKIDRYKRLMESDMGRLKAANYWAPLYKEQKKLEKQMEKLFYGKIIKGELGERELKELDDIAFRAYALADKINDKYEIWYEIPPYDEVDFIYAPPVEALRTGVPVTPPAQPPKLQYNLNNSFKTSKRSKKQVMNMGQLSLLDFKKKKTKKKSRRPHKVTRKTRRSHRKKKRTYRVPKGMSMTQLRKLILELRKRARKFRGPVMELDWKGRKAVVWFENRFMKKDDRPEPEKYSESRDKKRRALPPGKRISRSGRVYYEYRKNRSDLSGGV